MRDTLEKAGGLGYVGRRIDLTTERLVFSIACIAIQKVSDIETKAGVLLHVTLIVL